MSINGDEDSAAALGLLYDYYKVVTMWRSVCVWGGGVSSQIPSPVSRPRGSICKAGRVARN